MQIFFLYFPASHIIMSTLAQISSPSSTEATSFKHDLSSQSDNILVSVSLTPIATPTLPLTSKASAITEVSSQGGFFSSSFRSLVTQNASSLIGKSIASTLY